MIPLKNKKTLECTIEELRKFSLSYLEKYNPSKQQLRTYLLKKYFNSPGSFKNKSELLKLIDLVIGDLEKNKFISDEFYAESKSRGFVKRGYSINKIRNYLLGKGIDKKYITGTISKIKIRNLIQIFFLPLKHAKEKELDLPEKKTIVHFFIKKIYLF